MTIYDNLEFTTCNICGSDDYDVYYEQEDTRYNETPRGKFHLVKCRRCGLLYLNPRPTEAVIGKFYPDSFYSDRPEENLRENDRIKWIISAFDLGKRRKQNALLEKLQIVSKHCNRVGRLLDVGCAAGEFLRSAQSQGWLVEGADISKEMCDYVYSNFGITCHNASINYLDLPFNHYDVVTFWASIEHIYDPKKALEGCHRTLKDKGIVVVLVPNADSLEEKWLKNIDHNPIDIPRHLYHFNVDSMTRLLQETGFKTKHVTHFTYNAIDRLTVVIEGFITNKLTSTNTLTKSIRFVGQNLAIIAGDLLSRIFALCGRSHSFINAILYGINTRVIIELSSDLQ
jgi:2-polyprenyl-3-methyl-5-hydroxy-6-metoxy-1,4-benzoquinol methylase